MPASPYALVSDLFGTGGYLRDPNSSTNSAIATIFLGVVSRLIDGESGQFFYDDGAYIRYLNGIGGPRIDTPAPFFGSSGTIAAASQGATSLTYTASTFAPRAPVANEAMVFDTGSNREVLTPTAVTGAGPYTLTVPATGFAHAAGRPATTFQITVAYFENQPTAQWIAELDGDGWTPPSNFYLYPNSISRVGSVSDQTAVKPWFAIDLPMIPISNTTWLPTTMIGKATVGITAHWGWPVIPDAIKDLTCRAASLMWRKRMAGQGDSNPAGTMVGIGEARALIASELKGSTYKLTYI